MTPPATAKKIREMVNGQKEAVVARLKITDRPYQKDQFFKEFSVKPDG